MKLLFKQRLFSWFDSYDIYDEAGRTVYTVHGQLDWGHNLQIYGVNGVNYGGVKEVVLTWLPKFELYQNGALLGTMRKKFTWFKPAYSLDFNGWQVSGNVMGWDYTITDARGGLVATASKQIWNFTDTYVIDVVYPQDALCALMFTLAIDAEKCSRS